MTALPATTPGVTAPDDSIEALFDRSPCGYLSTGSRGIIVSVNQTSLDWTGFQPADLVGRRTFVQLLTPGGRIDHETHYHPALQMHGKVHEIALEIICADGRRLAALINSTLEPHPAGPAR